MKKSVKIIVFLVIILIFAIIFFFVYNRNINLLGRVIEFSDEQQSKGNVIPIMIISFIAIGTVILFTFKNLIDDKFNKRLTSEELDRLIGKP